MADRTAAFMLHRSASFGTGAALMGSLLDAGIVAGGMHVGLNRLGYGVGTGENLAVAETGRAVAGNAQQLFDYLPRLNAASPGKRDHPPQCLCL